MLMVDVGMKTYKWEGKKPTESSRDLNKITKPHVGFREGFKARSTEVKGRERNHKVNMIAI